MIDRPHGRRSRCADRTRDIDDYMMRAFKFVKADGAISLAIQ
jgi:hypothetical protein